MTLPVVLDADGLDALCERKPPERLRTLLGEAWARGRDVLVPAVVCAELCRGVPRTRGVEAALKRHDPARGQRPPVTVVDTDFSLARQVGAVLHGADAGSRDVVNAHVVAVCALHGGGMVVTATPGTSPGSLEPSPQPESSPAPPADPHVPVCAIEPREGDRASLSA